MKILQAPRIHTQFFVTVIQSTSLFYMNYKAWVNMLLLLIENKSQGRKLVGMGWYWRRWLQHYFLEQIHESTCVRDWIPGWICIFLHVSYLCPLRGPRSNEHTYYPDLGFQYYFFLTRTGCSSEDGPDSVARLSRYKASLDYHVISESKVVQTEWLGVWHEDKITI